MNSKLWIRKALSSCVMVAILATYSMVALANERKAAGELLISGSSVVTVDGQTAETGRTIFSGSTFSTSDAASAVLNLGAAGSVRLAPSSTAVLNFDGKNISAKLTAGSLTVLNAANAVDVNGSSVAAGATAKADDDDKDDDKDGGAAWWAFALVMGGAAAVLIGVIASDNDNRVGGTGTVVSPTR